ncbi:VOC family protein [Nocardia farcinica]|uniref:VOC family protein n=1 Tax=Nocardia farcinica TaxID=37329 RepID=UPI00245564FF|nr:VOC family protein [Nocardia farcinica]
MAAVSQLSYVVGTSSDVSAWKQYATEVLGLEVSRDSSDSLLYIRADDRHHRLGVRAGHDDDVAYVGWDVASKSALDAAAARLDAGGVAVTAGSAAEAADRRVMEFVYFICPYSGVRMELVLGHEKLFLPKFRPTRDIAGFNTGDMGMGHVVLYASDIAGAAEFYSHVLGFGVSDFAHIPEVGPFAVFLHCNARHHSLAFMNIPTATRRIQHVMFETVSIDDVGVSYDLCAERGITSTSTGRHQNDHVFSFYFGNPSGWHFEYGWGPRMVDPETWTTENYVLGSGFAWGHHGLMKMV